MHAILFYYLIQLFNLICKVKYTNFMSPGKVFTFKSRSNYSTKFIIVLLYIFIVYIFAYKI